MASREGQGSDDNEGLGIPINVHGPWASPSIAPDMEAIAKEALSNHEAIGDAIEVIQDGGAEGLNGDGEGGGLLDSLGGDGDGGSALDSLFD